MVPRTLPPLPDAIGCKAWGLLRASGGAVAPLKGAAGTAYLDAGGEILWATAGGALPHPRAISFATPLSSGWTGGHIELGDLVPWTPSLPARIAGGRRSLADRAAALIASIDAEASPCGLGRWLVGREPDFPLASAGPPALALATAIAVGDGDAAGQAAGWLFGFGPGLTPSGDDFIAGALFATRLRAAAGPPADETGARLRRAILAALPGRTNRISAALLGDAAEGLGFAALHELCQTLAGGESAAMSAAARRLVAIGHSSGWDLLAGLLAGVGGLRLTGATAPLPFGCAMAVDG